MNRKYLSQLESHAYKVLLFHFLAFVAFTCWMI